MLKKLFLGFLLTLGFISIGYADMYPVIVEAKKHAILSAQRDGALVLFNADVGDKVKESDFLGMIFHEDLTISKKKYEAGNVYWKDQVKDIGSLNTSGFASNSEIAKARLEEAISENEIEFVNSEIKKSKFYAPFAGIIVRRYVRQYEWVKKGEPVIELYNPNELYFITNLPSADVMKFDIGKSHDFFVSDINANIKGKLDVIEPTVDIHSNTIKTYWQISLSGNETEKKLLPGMRGIMVLKENHEESP